MRRLLLACSPCGPCLAQQYPSRVVTIIVPYPAGGPTDQLAREIAPALAEKLGQNFIVENVSGGGTTIATARVARAAPDGHTLLLHNLQISANVSLYGNLPVRHREGSRRRSSSSTTTRWCWPAARPSRRTRSSELIAYVKTNVLKMAHPGIGATGHLATSLFAQEAKVTVDHIPYRGAAPALQDIAGGHVDLFFATPQSVVQQVAAGQMKAYGITAKAPSPQFPGVESFVQALGPKLEILYWHALFAPAGTPDAIVETLNATVQAITADPALLKSWADTGVSPYPQDQRSPRPRRALLRARSRAGARWCATTTSRRRRSSRTQRGTGERRVRQPRPASMREKVCSGHFRKRSSLGEEVAPGAGAPVLARKIFWVEFGGETARPGVGATKYPERA